jgi:hypothetical protein
MRQTRPSYGLGIWEFQRVLQNARDMKDASSSRVTAYKQGCRPHYRSDQDNALGFQDTQQWWGDLPQSSNYAHVCINLCVCVYTYT